MPNLIVSNDSKCALVVADTKGVALFSNVTFGVKPIATNSRCFNEADQAFTQKTVDEWLKERMIQPSTSPWKAQTVVVKNELNCRKKRLCVDYSQTFNIFTELDGYPLPRIDDMINELSKYKVLWTFDLQSAYHQIRLTPSDCKYTVFEGKLFEFTRNPFCVKKIPTQMCKFIEKENLMGAFSYLDNITVAGHDQANYDCNQTSFLKAICRGDFTLNNNKTISSVKHINILGYVVGNLKLNQIRSDCASCKFSYAL